VTSQYLPWFKNTILLDNIKFSLLSKPFTMQLSLAKDLCGLVMACLLLSWNKNILDWKKEDGSTPVEISIFLIILNSSSVFNSAFLENYVLSFVNKKNHRIHD
jgi:hypothetical protein